MKKKKMNVLALTIVLFNTNLVKSQEASVITTDSKKYSIGVGISESYELYNSLFSLNVRKYYKDYNLKGALFYRKSPTFIKYDYEYNPAGGYNGLPTPLTSPDSSNTFVGRSSYSYKQETLGRARFGIEKQFKLGLVNFIGGVDAILDYYKISSTTSINNYSITENYSNQDYLNPFLKYYVANPISNINTLVSTSNFIHYGIGLNFGLKLNITKNIFISAIFSYDFIDGQNIKTTNNYNNDNFKNQLYEGNSDIRSNFGNNISLNYRF